MPFARPSLLLCHLPSTEERIGRQDAGSDNPLQTREKMLRPTILLLVDASPQRDEVSFCVGQVDVRPAGFLVAEREHESRQELSF